MKKHTLLLAILLSAASALMAQNSLMAPGMSGNSYPAPGAPAGFGSGFGPTYAPPGPWMPGNYPYGPPPYIPSGIIYSGSANWQNAGTITVMAAGYDAIGVWRTIPLVVNYQYNGVQYNVIVLSAWNPWSEQWDRGLSDQAVNTSYELRGTDYDFYVVLSTGTFYFNL